MLIAVALLMTIAAVLLLRTAWQARRQGRPRARAACLIGGWGLLALSLAPWCLAGGVDRGVALALVAAMIVALALLASAAWRGARAPQRRRDERRRSGHAGAERTTPLRRVGRRTLIFLLAGPVAAAAALVVTVDVYAWTMRWAAADRLAAALLLMPVAWSLLGMLATYDCPLRVRGGAVITVLFAGLAGLYLSPGGGA